MGLEPSITCDAVSVLTADGGNRALAAAYRRAAGRYVSGDRR